LLNGSFGMKTLQYGKYSSGTSNMACGKEVNKNVILYGNTNL
jgi:hypothetical protein